MQALNNEMLSIYKRYCHIRWKRASSLRYLRYMILVKKGSLRVQDRKGSEIIDVILDALRLLQEAGQLSCFVVHLIVCNITGSIMFRLRVSQAAVVEALTECCPIVMLFKSSQMSKASH